jgi:hypothetical protein
MGVVCEWAPGRSIQRFTRITLPGAACAPYAVAHVRHVGVRAGGRAVASAIPAARWPGGYGEGATRTGLHLRATASSHNGPHRPRQLAVVRHVDVTDRACAATARGRAAQNAAGEARTLLSVVRHVASPTESVPRPLRAAGPTLSRLAGQYSCARAPYSGSPARGTVSGDGRPPSVRVRCAGLGY